jgi:hypothetical protein
MWYDFVIGVASIMLYVFDVYSDLRLSATYYSDGDYGYFGVTLSLALASYLINVGLSFYWFVHGKDLMLTTACFFTVLILLNFGPVLA